MGPSPRKPDPPVPALDAETLEDFLQGRLEGAERARVIAILKDLPDDDFQVFADAAAVLRQMEYEGPAAKISKIVGRIISRIRGSRPSPAEPQ